MSTLFEARDRAAILDRIGVLQPDRAPRWGRFAPAEMVCHVSASLRQALGEYEAKGARGALSVWPLNWLAIHVAPWPKGKTQSPPEFLAVKPTTWDADLDRLRDLVTRFGDRGPGDEWPASPFFGRISGRSWGVLQYRHLDHHLTQFGA